MSGYAKILDPLVERQYVVLIDTGCDWPDVVFVGSWEDAQSFDRGLDDRGYPTSIQAVVTMDEVEEHQAEIEDEGR